MMSRMYRVKTITRRIKTQGVVGHRNQFLPFSLWLLHQVLLLLRWPGAPGESMEGWLAGSFLDVAGDLHDKLGQSCFETCKKLKQMLHMHLSQLKNMFPHSIQIESSPFTLQQKCTTFYWRRFFPKFWTFLPCFFTMFYPLNWGSPSTFAAFRNFTSSPIAFPQWWRCRWSHGDKKNRERYKYSHQDFWHSNRLSINLG